MFHAELCAQCTAKWQDCEDMHLTGARVAGAVTGKMGFDIQDIRDMTVPFKKIAESLSEVLPVDLADDVKKNVRAMVQSSLEKMDLVTREELEVQEKVLARTRSQLEVLQQRVTELEDALKRSADP